jgi:hypothetical protein
MSQLGIPGVEAPKKKASPAATLCKCGHDIAEHAGGKAPCAYGAHFGSPCPCKRFVARGRKPKPTARNFAQPLGARELTRPDLKREGKRMGWASVTTGHVAGIRTALLTIYLEDLRTKSPNETRYIYHANIPKTKRDQLLGALHAANKKAVECAQAAVEENLPGGVDALPVRVSITRVVGGCGLDDDNLRGALKYIRDGIADALGIDDKRFNIEGGIPLEYSQATPGTRGACGVKIDIHWEVSS